VAGDLQVEGERGQVMPDEVVELPGDAHALGDAARLGQELLGGAQFGALARQFLTSRRLAQRAVCGHQGEELEAEIRQRLYQGDGHVSLAQGGNNAYEERLRRHPDEPSLEVEDVRGVHCGDDEEDGHEAVPR
jgi:hypothetical protein